MDLRRKTIIALIWSMINQSSTQLISFASSIILARLLAPQDFGLFSMILVFVGFTTIFANLGFGAALIQFEDIAEQHLSSVFWINIITGVILTALVFLCAPLIAIFYHEPRIEIMLKVHAGGFLFSSLGIVHHTILSREMNFKPIAILRIITATVSSIFGILLALQNYGVWSLIGQNFLSICIASLGMWCISPWRPRLIFDLSALRQLYGFSSNTLGFNAFNYWLRQGDDVLIGRLLGANALGLYSKAYSFMMLPIQQLSWVLISVLFPALSRLQKEKETVKQIYLSTISKIALLTFPLMLGLIVTAKPFVLTLFGEQWTAMIPVLQILSGVGLYQSVATTVGVIYQSQGRADWLFRWGLAAGLVILGAFTVGVFVFGSIEGVAGCYTAANVLLAYPLFTIPGKLIGMRFRDVVDVLSGVFYCSVCMAVSIMLIGWVLPISWPDWLLLLIQILAGIILYLALINSFRIKAYIELLELIKEQWVSNTAEKQHLSVLKK